MAGALLLVNKRGSRGFHSAFKGMNGIFNKYSRNKWRRNPEENKPRSGEGRFETRRTKVAKRKYKKSRSVPLKKKKVVQAAKTVKHRKTYAKPTVKMYKKRRVKRYQHTKPAARVFSGRGWWDNHIGHVDASKRGWSFRRKGVRYVKGKRIPLKSKCTGKPYRKPSGFSVKRHQFPIWRNPMLFGEGGIIAPLALATLGFVGSAAIMANLPDSVKEKMIVGEEKKFNVGAVAVPLAVGLGLMFLAPKVKPLQPYSKHIFFAALGFGIAGAVSGITQAVSGTEFGKKIGVSGYVRRPLMSGYVRRPLLNGYTVARSMGQVNIQNSVPMLESAGAPSPAIKPYGVGLPTESRRYNEFDFGGVYGRSVYER
jgi:hypothetical protein